MFNFRRFFPRALTYMEHAAALLPSDSHLKSAVYWVEQAHERFTDNHRRRIYASGRMMEKGMTEAEANLAVELAVNLIKTGKV